jgi:hypothetical protein
VLARFRRCCACRGCSRKNVAPGSPESDDLRLGRPTASLVLSLFGRISLFQSPAWDSPKLSLLECIHLVGDIGPVLSRYLLLDFFEEVGEVVQAADRGAASVLAELRRTCAGRPAKWHARRGVARPPTFSPALLPLASQSSLCATCSALNCRPSGGPLGDRITASAPPLFPVPASLSLVFFCGGDSG